MTETELTGNTQVSSLNGPPLFIVSSGRAGTTLLRVMLNRGKNIFIPLESDFIARAFPHFSEDKPIPPEKYKLLASIFRHHSQKKGWGLEKEEIVSYLEEAKPKDYAESVAGIVDLYFDQNNIEPSRWGIKAPVLIASIDRILETFPNAKVVHMVRDGRDVCLSYQNVHETTEDTFGPKRIHENALYWIDGLRRVATFEDQVFDVRYEDLVLQPEETLKALCSFLELPFTTEMLDSSSENSSQKMDLVSTHSKTIHKNLSKKLLKDNINKYRSKMTKGDIMIYELLAAKYLKKYGYQLTFPILSFFLFDLLRFPAYWFARKFNDWRYGKRDKNALNLVSKH
jgi:hypothetical protein